MISRHSKLINEFRSVSTQGVGKIVIASFNLLITFINPFFLDSALLIELIRSLALIMFFSSIFELGSSRIMMKKTFETKELTTQLADHVNLIMSNILVTLPFIILYFIFIGSGDLAYSSQILVISLFTTLISPQKLLALKQNKNIVWVIYEAVLSFQFVLLSLLLIFTQDIITSLCVVAIFYTLISAYTLYGVICKIKISFTHIFQYWNLLLETVICSALINSIAFLDFGFNQNTHYYTVRFLSLSTMLASLYVNYVYQKKKNSAKLMLAIATLFPTLNITLNILNLMEYNTVVIALWLFIFCYVVIVWTANLFNYMSLWYANTLSVVVGYLVLQLDVIDVRHLLFCMLAIVGSSLLWLGFSEKSPESTSEL